MATSTTPKYTAVYKPFDLKLFKRGRVEKIVGNSKKKLIQELNTITMQGVSYVWAVFDNKGECIEGGTTSENVGNSFLWDKDHLNTIAQRFFGTSSLYKHKQS